MRLVGGVVPRSDQGVWFLDPAGQAVHAKRLQVQPGTPVVVGPRSAKAETVLAALTALDRWVSGAGSVVAGADIDLGAGQDSPELARAINANPDGGLIRAAVLAVTSHGGIPLQWPGPSGPAHGAVTAISPPRRIQIPGFPPSSLNDDRWQAAMPDAVELGATPETFWEHIAAHGPLVPTSWIPHSWPVLWARSLKDQ